MPKLLELKFYYIKQASFGIINSIGSTGRRKVSKFYILMYKYFRTLTMDMPYNIEELEWLMAILNKPQSQYSFIKIFFEI